MPQLKDSIGFTDQGPAIASPDEVQRLREFVNLKLAARGHQIVGNESDYPFLDLGRSLIASFQEKTRLLSDHLCPVDQAILDNSYLLHSLDGVTWSSMVIDREGTSSPWLASSINGNRALMANDDGTYRVFELVADGHPLPGFDQFGQVGIQGVVREARQGGLVAPVVALGEHNVEDIGRLFGIRPEGLVEIAHPEQQQRIRIPALDAVVLLHQRGFFLAFGCQGGSELVDERKYAIRPAPSKAVDIFG